MHTHPVSPLSVQRAVTVQQKQTVCASLLMYIAVCLLLLLLLWPIVCLPSLWPCCTDSKAGPQYRRYIAHWMVSVVIRTGVGLHVSTETETAIQTFCGYVRSVRNKQTELFDNVCYVDFQIVCLTEICLKDICFYHKIFPFPHSLAFSVLVALNLVLLI